MIGDLENVVNMAEGMKKVFTLPLNVLPDSLAWLTSRSLMLSRQLCCECCHLVGAIMVILKPQTNASYNVFKLLFPSE